VLIRVIATPFDPVAEDVSVVPRPTASYAMVVETLSRPDVVKSRPSVS